MSFSNQGFLSMAKKTSRRRRRRLAQRLLSFFSKRDRVASRRTSDRQLLGEFLEVRTMLAGDLPSFVNIPSTALLGGSPLAISLDGFEAGGRQLTYTVTSSNPSLVSPSLIGDRSIKFSVTHTSSGQAGDTSFSGDMVFQLFEDESPLATSRMITLAQSGFYNNIIFHRVINGFVIQAGDPTATGGGGSGLGTFDDQFTTDLQHNRTGLLSMAKSTDDTNDSQFFVTEGPTRGLDFNHTIFGALIEGESIRESISNVTTPHSRDPQNDNASDKPDSNVTITSATVFNDLQNKVLLLKAANGASGTANITVTVTDSEGESFQQTFAVSVSADTSNGAPFLGPISEPIRTTIGQAVNLQLTSTDVEGDAVFYDAVKVPSNNANYTISTNNTTGVVTITPAAGFTGTFQVLVGVRAATTANTVDTFDTQTVDVVVAPTAPTGIDLQASSDSGILNTDNLTNLTTLTFDVTGVTSGATVKLYKGSTVVGQAVSSGSTVSITTNNPSAFTNGVNTLRATQTLNTIESDLSGGIDVTIDNLVPAAFTSTPPAVALIGQPFNYDPTNPDEGNNTSYSIANPVAGMTINSTTGVIAWTPTAAQSGLQQFDIRLSDAAGNFRTQSVSLIVGDPLPSEEDEYTIDEDSALEVDAESGVLSNDGDESTSSMTATLVSGPSHGTLEFNSDGSFTYTPNDDFNGEDGFVYRATSNGSASLDTVVTITVIAVNDAPISIADQYATSIGTAITVTAANGVLKNDTDVDNSSLTAVLDDGPSHGTLTLNTDGSFVYTPTTGFFGADSFTYHSNDGELDSDVVTVTVNVTNGPTANNDSYTVTEDSTLTVAAADGVLKNDTDPENDFLTVSIIQQPSHGALTFNTDGSFVYTPNPSFAGTDTFTYRANDGTTNSNIASVVITVNNTNDAPQSQSDVYTVNEDTSLSVTLQNGLLVNDSDIDGDTITAIQVTGPSNGTLTLSPNGTFFYAPNSHFNGTDTFTYKANDGSLDSNVVTVTINVTAQPDPPNAVDDTFTAFRGDTARTVSVLSNDTSAPDTTQAMTVTAVTQGSQGGVVTITNNGANVSYQPAANFFGTETFTYTITDSDGLMDTATVTVTVNESQPSQLSGFAYYDLNDDGIVSESERRIPGVTITLTGTNSQNAAVNLTTTTDSNGAYSFTNLLPGNYSVTQTGLNELLDGKDTIGTQGGTAGNNNFSIQLAQGINGTGNNFGKRGLPAAQITLQSFFASTHAANAAASAASLALTEDSNEAPMSAALATNIIDASAASDSSSSDEAALTSSTTTVDQASQEVSDDTDIALALALAAGKTENIDESLANDTSDRTDKMAEAIDAALEGEINYLEEDWIDDTVDVTTSESSGELLEVALESEDWID